MVVNNSLQNLHLDIQGRAQGVKPGGEAMEREITLYNRGDRRAQLEIGIEPGDARSEAVMRWHQFSVSDADLQLEPGAQKTITLSFVVPLQAEPGFYSYNVLLRSQHYPSEVIRRSQQLQVLPPEQETLRTEPRITLSPTTDSLHPYVLAPGTNFPLTITIENPSLRTDRFFVSCPDLPATWYTVQYPENDANVPGLVNRTNGLQLNPREIGEIQVMIHPPPFTRAGNYFPTLRVTASNRPELALLEIIYLTIPVEDRLFLSLSPDSRKLPAAEDWFEVLIQNPGNIERELELLAQDDEHKLRYLLTPERFSLPPGGAGIATLRPKARHRWRQLWRLRDQTITVGVAAQNLTVSEPPPTASSNGRGAIAPLQLPSPVTGTIHWKARRRWLFWLLVALLALGLLTTAAWLLWYFLVWRPSLRPQIASFATSQETYQESLSEEDEGLTLDWSITNAEQIEQLTLMAEGSADGSPTSRTYRLNQDGSPIPGELDPYCKIGEAESATSPVANLLRLQRRLTGRSPNTPLLQCRGVPPAGFVTQEGRYTFELQVYPQRPDGTASHPTAIKTLQNVTVGPPPPPKIRSLAATATEYSLLSAEAVVPRPEPSPQTAVPIVERSLQSTSPQTIPDLTETPPTQTIPPTIAPTPSPNPIPERRPPGPIRLNWDISNVEDIAQLKLVSLAPDGSENTEPVFFDFRNGIPFALQPYCQNQRNTLICTQVPTTATAVGNYVFHLTVIPTDGAGGEPIVASTATIPIKPPPPEILEFTLNGARVSDRPKQVFVINPARGSLDLQLRWQVRHANQVELLPAPGIVQTNTLTYTVSATPGSETITLRAVNELDEEVTQTVVVEKVGFGDPAAGTAVPGASGMQPGQPFLPPPPPPTIIPVPATPLPPAPIPPRAN